MKDNITTPRTNKSWNMNGDDAEAAWSFARTLEQENNLLRALINEPYQFFTFGHKALQPWGNALDDWCKRAKPFTTDDN